MAAALLKSREDQIDPLSVQSVTTPGTAKLDDRVDGGHARAASEEAALTGGGAAAVNQAVAWTIGQETPKRARKPAGTAALVLGPPLRAVAAVGAAGGESGGAQRTSTLRKERSGVSGNVRIGVAAATRNSSGSGSGDGDGDCSGHGLSYGEDASENAKVAKLVGDLREARREALEFKAAVKAQRAEATTNEEARVVSATEPTFRSPP